MQCEPIESLRRPYPKWQAFKVRKLVILTGCHFGSILLRYLQTTPFVQDLQNEASLGGSFCRTQKLLMEIPIFVRWPKFMF